MEFNDRGKYLAIALFFSVMVVLGLFFVLRAIYIYFLILIFYVYVATFLKLTPIKGETSKLVFLMCGVFVVYLILSYYFRFVVEDTRSNVMRGIAMPPMIIGIVLAPIIEEIGFRRVLLGALLNAKVHWLVACFLTTLVFILGHSPSNWIYILVPSFLFSSIYTFSGNLKLVIFLHFCHNAIFYIDPRIWSK